MKSRFAIAIMASISLLASQAAAQTLGFGTSNPGSATYSISAAIAKVLTEKAGLKTVVQPYGGQSAFVPAVNAGEQDFGICNAYELEDAVKGKGIYKGRVLDNLRAIAVLMPLRTALWVAKDSPIKSIKDLKGKRVPGDWSAQKIIGPLMDALLASAGLSYKDVIMVPVPNVNRGAEDFIQGKVDAFYFAVGSGKVLEAGSKVGGLRALPIDPSPESLAIMRKYNPVVYPSLVKPSAANYGIHKPTYVAAMDFLLLTNRKESEDLIYKVTKVVHESKKEFIASFKTFGLSFEPSEMCKELPSGKYHSGAIKFYKEAALWPPKKAFTDK